jgi:hypothetical protein
MTLSDKHLAADQSHEAYRAALDPAAIAICPGCDEHGYIHFPDGTRGRCSHTRTAASAPVGGRLLRPILTWAVVLGTGIVLLYGRFDWRPSHYVNSKTAFVLSVYLFVITVPLVYYVTRALVRSRRIAVGLTAVVWLIFSLPYRWLGLDRWFYYAHRPYFYTRAQVHITPTTTFLPSGLDHSDFPYEAGFFVGLAVVAIAIATVRWWRGRATSSSRHNALIALAVIAFCAILAQTFLHTSMRSPYTYVPHYQQPAAAKFWYQDYMFANGTGAVDADQFADTAIEQYFHAVDRTGKNELIRRPYAGYVAAQFSYFVNNYYISLLINIGCWFVAVVCGYLLALRLTEKRIALIFAALIATGTGFILFVATPASYLMSYTLVIVVLYLFERLVVDAPGSFWRYLVFGLVLGLSSLVYDFWMLYPVLLAYGYVRKVRLRFLLCSLACALAVYGGFLFAHNVILGLRIDPTNSNQVNQASNGVIHVLTHPSPNLWYEKLLDVATTYPAQLAEIFFVIPVGLAFIGALWLRDRTIAVLSVAFVAVTLGTLAFIRIGGQQALGNIPRIVYPAYPAIYLLAAIALVRIGDLRGPNGLTMLARWAPWFLIGLIIVVNNVDAFGFPALYYQAVHNAPLGHVVPGS